MEQTLRILVLLHLLAIFTQAVLAGQFLSGADGAVLFHESAGWTVASIGLAQVICTVVMKPPRASLTLILSSALIFLAEALQVGTGYLRFLGVHIPLAVLIAGGVAAQAVRVFRS